MELESVPIDLPYILGKYHRLKICLECLKLEIYFALIVGNDWDSIVDLVRIRVCRIVNQDCLRQVSIHHSQVLDMHSLCAVVTMLPEQTMRNVFILGVQIVQNYIRIA